MLAHHQHVMGDALHGQCLLPLHDPDINTAWFLPESYNPKRILGSRWSSPASKNVSSTPLISHLRSRADHYASPDPLIPTAADFCAPLPPSSPPRHTSYPPSGTFRSNTAVGMSSLRNRGPSHALLGLRHWHSMTHDWRERQGIRILGCLDGSRETWLRENVHVLHFLEQSLIRIAGSGDRTVSPFWDPTISTLGS